MIHVLYVDDEPDLLSIGKLFLELTGEIQVDTSESGKAALGVLRTGGYDAIISDYQMPGMDGITFLKEVRQQFGAIPFILFTGRGREEVVVEALNNGADFYLQKGGDPRSQFAELSSKIQLAVRRRRAEQALQESESRFRDLTENSLDTIMLFDRDLRHVYVNPNVKLQTGIPASEYIGRTHAELPFPPDLTALWQQTLRETFESAKNRRIEFALPNGSWIDWLLVPIHAPDGSVNQVITSARDITDRKKAEDTLRQASEQIRASEEKLRSSYDELAKSEKRARENEENYRSLVGNIPGVVYHCANDPDWTIHYISPAILTLSGYPASDFIGNAVRSYASIIHPDDRGPVDRAVQAGVQKKEIYSIEYRILRADGSVRWVYERGQGIFSKNGDLLWLNGVVLDQTGQRQVTDALQKSEEQYRRLVETTGTGYVILDTGGRVITANPEYLRLCGRSLEEIQGRPVTDWTAPYDLERNAREVEKCVRTGSIRGLEIDYLKPDGMIQPVEINASTVNAESGPIILTLCRDITGRRAAEAALKKEQEFTRLLLDTMPAFFVAIGADGRTITMNRALAETLEYTQDEIRGADYLTRFVPEEDRHLLGEVFRQIMLDGRKTVNENRIISKSGNISLVEWHGMPVKHADGKPDFLVGVGIDISERKRAERELQQSRDLFRSFIDHSYDAVFIHDSEGRVLDVNTRVLELYQVSRKDALRLTITGFFGPGESMEEARERWLQVLAGNDRFFRCEARRPGDGSHFDVEMYLTRIQMEDRPVILANVRDITGRIRAEEELKTARDELELRVQERTSALVQSERRLSDLINHLPDATFAIDPEGRVIAWNRAMEEMTGVSHEQILGKGDHEYAIPFYGHRRPMLVDLVFSSDEEIEKNYYHIIRKEGDVIVAESDLPRPLGKVSHLWGKASPLYDETGTKIGAIESVRDVTEWKRAEVALRESEDKYRALFENSGSPLMIINDDSTIVLVNREFEKLLGYPRDEIMGRMSWTEFIAEEADLVKMKEYHRLRRISSDLAPVTYDSRIINRNGDIRDVIITVVMIPATRQSLAALVDITDRKRAEEALRRSEERFRGIASNLPGIVYQFYARDSGEWGMNFISERSRDVYGLAAEPLDTWFSRFTACIAPEDQDRWAGSIKDVIRRVAPWVFEGRFIKPDGVEMYIRGISQPIRLTTETVWNGILIDITDRKKAEIALEDAKDLAENLIETANAIIVGLDNDGRITIYNQETERITGYSREEMANRNWFETIVPKDRFPYVHDEFSRLMAGGLPKHFENPILTKNGELRYIAWKNNEIRKQGKIVGTISFGIDITDRKLAEDQIRALYGELEQRVLERTADLRRAEEAFRQANAKLNLLSSITRHDILNQLMALRGFLELTSLKEKDDVTGMYIQKALRAAATIERHISFTKQYQDIGVKSPVWQNVRECAGKPVADLLPASIACMLDLEGIEVYADPLCEKVIYTLIDNSLRHGGPVTEIRLSARAWETGGLVLLYTDNGVGIRAEDKERIFERGFGKHTGFGLFLAREILAITGITITETGKPGKGARFEMVVPEGAYRFTGTDKTG